MDARLRFLPAALVAVLVTWRVFVPTFLVDRIWESVPLSWFWAVLIPLSWLAAWLITPPFMRVMNLVAKHAFLPVAFFIILVLGAFVLADAAWNHWVRPWCDACPEAHFVRSTVTAVFGGV